MSGLRNGESRSAENRLAACGDSYGDLEKDWGQNMFQPLCLNFSFYASWRHWKRWVACSMHDFRKTKR